MAEDIQPPENLVAGESFTFEFTITEDGSAKDISGASLSWYLLPSRGDDTADAVLEDSDGDVSATITDAANGRADVVVDQGATSDLSGRYWQRFEVDDAGSGLQIWRGDVYIEAP